MLIVVAVRAQEERVHTFQGKLPQEPRRSLKVAALQDSSPSPVNGRVETPGLSQVLSQLLIAFNPAAGRPLGRRPTRRGHAVMAQNEIPVLSLGGVTILDLWNQVAQDAQKAVSAEEKKLLGRMDEVKVALKQMGTPREWGEWGTPDELLCLSKGQTCSRPTRFAMPSDVMAMAPVWYRDSMRLNGKLDEVATQNGFTDSTAGFIPVVKLRDIIPSPVMGPMDWMPEVEVMEKLKKELLIRIVKRAADAGRPVVVEHANDWSEERYRELGFVRMDEDYMVFGETPLKTIETADAFDMAVLQKH